MKVNKYGLLSFAAIVTMTFIVNGIHGTAMAVTHGEHTQEHAATTHETDTSGDKQSSRADAQTKAEARMSERHAATNEKLSATKQKACEKHKANIHNRMTKISDRAAKHLNLFTTISDRAQAFYANKGNSLTNYDELVATVNAKKAAAEATITSATTATSGFTCDSANPKQAVEEFRTSLKSTITALKEYRTSVKDLIVGIKSVNGTQTTKTNPTEDAQ